MTVRELMEKLNHYNPDAEVVIEYTDECGDTELKSIDNMYFNVVSFAVVLENIF